MSGKESPSSGSTAVVTVEKVEPPSPDDLAKAARALDESINDNIRDLGTQMAETYLKIGQQLIQMRETGGWSLLHFETWSKYLESKTTYGKTYLSYLLRLGQADQSKIAGLLAKGLTGTHLVEYAKATTDPAKIPGLIEKTWKNVAKKPTREATKVIKAYVADHKDQFKPNPRKGGGRPKASAKDRVWTFLKKLDSAHQMEVVLLMNSFQNAKDLEEFMSVKPTRDHRE